MEVAEFFGGHKRISLPGIKPFDNMLRRSNRLHALVLGICLRLEPEIWNVIELQWGWLWFLVSKVLVMPLLRQDWLTLIALAFKIMPGRFAPFLALGHASQSLNRFLNVVGVLTSKALLLLSNGIT